MKKLRILSEVLRQTKANRILISYLLFVLLDALVIWLWDPEIATYGNALWYCCSVISTAGFGDLVATTFVTKVFTVLLMIYSVFVVAIVTGVIVNYYNQLIKTKQEETVERFLQKLENLPELSKEELRELSGQVKKYLNR